MSHSDSSDSSCPALSRGRDGVHVRVKVNPRSAREQIVDVASDPIRVKLTAPPVEGEANRALVELFSKACHVPMVDVEIVSGRQSSRKTLLIRGLELSEVVKGLERSLGTGGRRKRRKKGAIPILKDPD